ncbi:Immunoglobulin-like domain [Trinorchestia longiramus]|nr:Immunoglobulin-like domain [Trinorchestia longiramus]
MIGGMEHCPTSPLTSCQVSWIRRRDLHVLSTGTFTYTNDDRFHVVHERRSPYWILSIQDTQQSDTGLYECQVPAQPKLFKRFWLSVIDNQKRKDFVRAFLDLANDETFTSHIIMSDKAHFHISVPHATVEGSSEVFMQAGGDIKMVCHVTGATPPTFIRWLHTAPGGKEFSALKWSETSLLEFDGESKNSTIKFSFCLLYQHLQASHLIRRRGWKRNVRTKKLIKNAQAKLRRNPRRCHRELAAEASVRKTSMYRVLKEDLEKKLYQIMKRHELTEHHERMRAERSRHILIEVAQGLLPNLVFTDEKIFDIQQVVNHQNDRIWSSSSSVEEDSEIQSSRL